MYDALDRTAEADEDMKMLVSPDVADAPKTCFTALSLTQRRFWSPLVPSACQLCPSMDLMVVGLKGGSLILHRTVVAQNLATISLAETAEGAVEADDDNNTLNSSEQQSSFFACFRPDGRILAVCSPKKMALYPIEELLTKGNVFNSIGSEGVAGSEGSQSISFALPKEKDIDSVLAIAGLHWAHLGSPHPAWDVAQEEQDDALYWKYAGRFCDQSTVLLPPSEYHKPQHATSTNSSVGHQDAQCGPAHAILPSSSSPLSVLCLVTMQNLHLYLHGSYKILTTPLSTIIPDGISVDVAVSNDLSHYMIYPQGSQILTMYSVPELPRQRYTLQMLSALSCSLLAHVRTIQANMHEVVASWKTSLKPLDLKLDLLTNLLFRYGLHESTTAYLVQYILSGHTRAAPSLANVMDQFFTHVQMNDQLLVRLESSLTVAVQNVELHFRKGLLSPVQTLLFQANELVGLAMVNSDGAAENASLLSVDAAKKLQRFSKRLYMVIETALAELVEARFRLRDFCAWLRSVGSQIKANGTGPNSVQRQNAKSRRVSDAIVERMLGYLQTEEVVATGVTEILLGLRFASLLNEASESVPGSPRDTGMGSGVLEESAIYVSKQLGTLPELMAIVSKTLDDLMEGPRCTLQDCVTLTRLEFQLDDAQAVAAIATRMGTGGVDPSNVPFGEAEHDGFFSLQEDEEPELLATCSMASPSIYKEWCVIAHALNAENQGLRDTILLHAVPLPCTGDTSKCQEIASTVYWTAMLRLPQGCAVLEVGFYNDDGKSSLSSGQDCGTGKERRHSLGMVVERATDIGMVVDLWIVSYDHCSFRREQFDARMDGRHVLRQESARDSNRCIYIIQPMPESYDEGGDMLPERTLYAKVRTIAFDCTGKDDKIFGRRLMLSGSRGVGAIVTDTSSIELYDLEEDEDEQADGDDSVVSMTD